jgi:hypothetical protein
MVYKNLLQGQPNILWGLKQIFIGGFFTINNNFFFKEVAPFLCNILRWNCYFFFLYIDFFGLLWAILIILINLIFFLNIFFRFSFCSPMHLYYFKFIFWLILKKHTFLNNKKIDCGRFSLIYFIVFSNIHMYYCIIFFTHVIVFF